MNQTIVFFVRSKPQGADIIDLVREEKRVFIGYPLYKRDSRYDETSIKSCMYDISQPESIDMKNIPSKFSRQIRKNINLVRAAIRNSYVIIPRPKQGKYYVGKITEFELVNNPAWKNRYKQLREKQGLKWEKKEGGSQYHVGDIVQSWKVEKEFEPILLYKFPAWVRYSLFGRSTTGRIGDFDDENKIYPLIEQLYEKRKVPLKELSVEQKLLRFLSPGNFEHFMSNLLSLEYKSRNQVWLPIGGSGDGGVDCICFDKSSEEFKGIAQCKLKKNQSINQAKEMLSKLNEDNNGENYVCNFYMTEDIPEGEYKGILNQKRILGLFEKHKESNYWEWI